MSTKSNETASHRPSVHTETKCPHIRRTKSPFINTKYPHIDTKCPLIGTKCLQTELKCPHMEPKIN